MSIMVKPDLRLYRTRKRKSSILLASSSSGVNAYLRRVIRFIGLAVLV